MREEISYDDELGPMSKARRNYNPPLPADLEEFAEAMSEYAPMEKLYKGSSVASDGSRVSIFASDTMLKALNSTKELIVDGTFEVITFFLLMLNTTILFKNYPIKFLLIYV